MKLSFYALFIYSLTSLSHPVLSMESKVDNSCLKAEKQALARLAIDNVLPVGSQNVISFFESGQTGLVIGKDTLEYFVSPTPRSQRYSITFVGKRAYDFMNSPVLLNEVARILINGCEDMAIVSFGLFGSGISAFYGKEADGGIRLWECYEDIGYFPGRKISTLEGEPPKWGYMYCTV